jgi:hypothetical protein
VWDSEESPLGEVPMSASSPAVSCAWPERCRATVGTKQREGASGWAACLLGLAEKEREESGPRG